MGKSVRICAYLDEWLGRLVGDTSDVSLDLFSCNQAKVSGGRQKISGRAAVVVTMPGIVM